MKIGIDIRCLMSLTRTGVAEYTYEFLSALFAHDKINQYYLYYNSYRDVSSNVRLWSGENIHYVASRWPNKFFSIVNVLFRLPRWGRGLDYFFSPNPNFISVAKGVKKIVTIHDLSFEILPECYSVKRRLWHKVVSPQRQCQTATIILTPSENTKRDVIKIFGIDAKKIKVLSPGVCSHLSEKQNQKKVQEKYNLPHKFVLFLGTLEPRKNIVGLIEAFVKSSLPGRGYYLIVAGAKGWKCGKILKKIAGEPKVRYLGYVADDDKHALYKAAEIFAYPSLYEGFGLPVLEALASGTPTLTSNRSALPEVANGSAYLINPHNVAEITKALDEMSENNNLNDKLIADGLNRAQEFDWEKSVEKFLTWL